MSKSLFNLLGKCVQSSGNADAATALTPEDVEQVSGGRMKLPTAVPVTVYYDDGITLITSDPTKNTH
jgi:hypothetical protein